MLEVRRGHLTAGLVAVALGLILTLSTGKDFTLTIMGKWASFLEVPEMPAVYIREAYGSFRGWVRERDQVLASLKRLNEENDSLYISIHMKDALSLKSKLESLSSSARVDLRLPLSWWQKVRLDKGLSEGVKKGDPVLQGRFLVGRVSLTSSDGAWVDLITSSSMLIPVVVRQTRDVGVLVGDDHGRLWLKYIPSESLVSQGMDLDTALMGENIPPGLPIGKVSSQLRVGDQGEKEYRVIHGGNLSKLYGVTVLDTAGGL